MILSVGIPHHPPVPRHPLVPEVHVSPQKDHAIPSRAVADKERFSFDAMILGAIHPLTESQVTSSNTPEMLHGCPPAPNAYVCMPSASAGDETQHMMQSADKKKPLLLY